MGTEYQIVNGQLIWREVGRHSPGPWNISPNSAFILSGNQIIATVASRNPNAAQDNILLAAAPDLLAACKFSLSVHRAQGLFDLSERLAVEKLEAAIAKAEGARFPRK